MIIIHQPEQLNNLLSKSRNEKAVTGFIPTMGALHHGHISLISQSRLQAQLTICSIFVNPTQFNDPLDYNNYPHSHDSDIKKLVEAGADILFMPQVNAMYKNGTENLEHYNLGSIETILEGKYRPGHFQGVCQVMSRLLYMVQPSRLFMGQKDYQQCLVIQKLISLLDIPVELISCPTLREADGLAMSSRNMRLTDEQRQVAPQIYETLIRTKKSLSPGDLSFIKNEARKSLEKSGFNVDYFEIARAENLQLLNTWNGTDKAVALTAAFLDGVRLIDNILLNP